MTNAERPLAGRGAIITGASMGLGRAIAEAFVRAGADVLLVARGAQALDEAYAAVAALASTGQVVAQLADDVSRPEGCAAIARRAQEALPALTVLVNNAGGYGPMGRLEDVAWGEWVAAMQTNLFGTALMCREVIPLLRARRYGKIVNLSGGGATAPMPGISAYGASKAAVVRLTESIALETRDDAIDVNALAPGALNTRMLDQVLAAGPERVGDAYYERALRQRDSGGESPERGAALAVFLASAASDGISGKLISAVWDDWASLAERRDRLMASDIYTLRRIVPEDRGEAW